MTSVPVTICIMFLLQN